MASPEFEERKSIGERAKRPSPNAFVSLRILSPSIHRGLEAVQRGMIEKNEDVKFALTSLDKLHITLRVVHLENHEEQDRAKVALLEVARKLNKDLGLHHDPLTLRLCGVSSFGGRVVFADIPDHERLARVAEIVQVVFQEHGFPDVGGHQKFNPHLTIAKMSLAHSHRRGGRQGRRGARGGLRTLDEELYAEFKDKEFGEEKVAGIELLSMTHPPSEDKYYHCFQKYTFKEL